MKIPDEELAKLANKVLADNLFGYLPMSMAAKLAQGVLDLETEREEREKEIERLEASDKRIRRIIDKASGVFQVGTATHVEHCVEALQTRAETAEKALEELKIVRGTLQALRGVCTDENFSDEHVGATVRIMLNAEKVKP